MRRFNRKLEKKLIERYNKDPLFRFDIACMQAHKPGGSLESLPPLPRCSDIPVPKYGPIYVTSGFKEIYEYSEDEKLPGVDELQELKELSYDQE